MRSAGQIDEMTMATRIYVRARLEAYATKEPASWQLAATGAVHETGRSYSSALTYPSARKGRLMPAKTDYEHGEFCWVDLMTSDVEPAKKFYGGLFGWQTELEHHEQGPPYFIFTIGGKHVGGLSEMNAQMRAQKMPPMWGSYINVKDIDDTVAQVAKLGGQVCVPTTQVMDHGQFAVISDPTGAMVSLWQKGKNIGAELRDEPSTLCWNELATRDIEKAKEFYGKLVGWKFQDFDSTPTKYYVITGGEGMWGGLMQMNEQWGDMPSNWSVYFAVDDTDKTCAKVKQLGGGICVEPFDISVGRMAVVNDAQGGTFAVIKLNPRA
jgi:predicted enzyme related to lactoylglutathione lyase